MDEDSRRALLVGLVLFGAVLAVIAWRVQRGATQPHLVEVVVVTRAAGEQVATDAFRTVAADAEVTAAAVVSFRRGESGEVRRLCVLPAVELGGELVPVEPLTAWPKSGGTLRAHWFTVEPAYFGGTGLEAAPATEKLAFKDFLAAGMGNELVAAVTWEANNDEFLREPPAGNAMGGGPVRLKVRVGTYADEHDLIASESVLSAGAERLWEGPLPGVARLPALPQPLAGRVAPFLRLACFGFADGVWPDGGPGWGLPLTPAQLVQRALLATPATLAAVAASGEPLGEPWTSGDPVVLHGAVWRRRAADRPLRWGSDVIAGDVLVAGERWLTLVSDDGDGELDIGDEVLFGWGEPARLAPLAHALPEGAAVATLRSLT